MTPHLPYCFIIVKTLWDHFSVSITWVPSLLITAQSKHQSENRTQWLGWQYYTPLSFWTYHGTNMNEALNQPKGHSFTKTSHTCRVVFPGILRRGKGDCKKTILTHRKHTAATVQYLCTEPSEQGPGIVPPPETSPQSLSTNSEIKNKGSECLSHLSFCTALMPALRR